MCALPSYYMKISPTRYGYRSGGFNSYYNKTNESEYSKYLSEDDFENMSCGNSELDSPNTSPSIVKADAENNDNKTQQYVPTEYINLDEETMRSYYDENYYCQSRKSDVEINPFRIAKKIPCSLQANFCITRKFAAIEVDALSYSLTCDYSDYDYSNKDYPNKFKTSPVSADNAAKEISLILKLRIMEFSDPNCMNYYAMIRHRDDATDFEQNYLLKIAPAEDKSEPNLETYDLFITASEIKNSNKIHTSQKKYFDKPITIYFTPEKNTDYVSFRLRNHLKTYILIDLRKNVLYMKGEDCAAFSEHTIPTKIYNKKIEVY